MFRVFCINEYFLHRCVSHKHTEIQTNHIPNQAFKYHFKITGLPCEVNNGHCDHICANTSSGPECSCRGGYDFYYPFYCVGKAVSYLTHTSQLNHCRYHR